MLNRALRLHATAARSASRAYRAFIDPKATRTTMNPTPKAKTPQEDLVFGRTFTDHMLEIDWDKERGWHDPVIKPFAALQLPPAATALHYGVQCFEGMKAYRGAQDQILLFRPDCNMERLNSSMTRLAMPPINGEGVVECIKQLLRVDASWVPRGDGYSMYIRPTAIGTSEFLGVHASEHVKLFVILSPVGPYYKDGFKPVKLYADTENVRAWPGGVGNVKVGGNYGPTIAPSQRALSLGCSQVMWLFGEDHEVTEVGAMNIFFAIRSKDSDVVELTTAPLTRGDILPGVTRRSILDIARKWALADMSLQVTERWLSMKEVRAAADDGRLLEVFGAGTAVVVSPVKSIVYEGAEIRVPTGEQIGPLSKRLWDALAAVQYGKVHSPWSVAV